MGTYAGFMRLLEMPDNGRLYAVAIERVNAARRTHRIAPPPLAHDRSRALRSRASGFRDRPLRHRQSRRAARGPPAPEVDRRSDRPAASARARQAARRRVRVGQAAFDDPVGAAGCREDDARAADGRRVQRRVHRALRRAGGRQGHPRRGRARRGDARPVGSAHDPVRRRGAPLQQGAAGRLPAVRRAGPRHVHRRDDRESLVRGQRRAAVACRGLRARAVVDRGARCAARSRARGRRARPRGRRRRARHADRVRGRRRPQARQSGRISRDRRGSGPPRADRRRVRRSDDRAEPAPLRQGRRGVLRPDLGVAQVGARIQSGRRAVLDVPDAGRRRRSALRRTAADPHGDRGHRPRRSARAVA